MKKLNLGSGKTKLDGFVNVDKYDIFDPDVVHDLEKFPWPFETDSVDYIMISHVLEHLGQTTEEFMGVLSELHRVCQDGAFIEVHVPHPHHFTAIGDPTHIRVITPEQFSLFDKNVYPESELRDSSGLEFRVDKLYYVPDWDFESALKTGNLKYEALVSRGKHEINIFRETRMLIEVVKGS